MKVDSIQGFILAGGASRRMGRDKSALVLEGQTLLEKIATQMKPITASITVIGRESATIDLMTVPDVYPSWGALGGLHAALESCTAEWALVTACDLPFVTPELFKRLCDLRDDFEAVAPIQHDGYPQPLCALYRRRPCLSTAVKLIEAGERRPIELLNTVRTRWVKFHELTDLNGADRFFANINTPEDYTRARDGRPNGPTATDTD